MGLREKVTMRSKMGGGKGIEGREPFDRTDQVRQEDEGKMTMQNAHHQGTDDHEISSSSPPQAINTQHGKHRKCRGYRARDNEKRKTKGQQRRSNPT